MGEKSDQTETGKTERGSVGQRVDMEKRDREGREC
jgi:hypothetical protein